MKSIQIILLFSHLWIVPNFFLGQTEPRPAETLSQPSSVLNAIIIDGEVTLFTKENGIGHTMLQMARHPDGAIDVNGHASGLFKSTDDGESCQRTRWKYDPGGFGISRVGRIWLVTGTTRSPNSVVLICQSADGEQTWQKQTLDCGPLAKGGMNLRHSGGDLHEFLRAPRQHMDVCLFHALP